MHGLWSGISRIFTPLSKEFYVRSAHSRAALTPQTGSMTPLNLLPQRFVSKPQAEWLLHGAAVSLSRSEAVSWESQDLKNEKLTLLLTRVIVFGQAFELSFLRCAPDNLLRRGLFFPSDDLLYCASAYGSSMQA